MPDKMTQSEIERVCLDSVIYVKLVNALSVQWKSVQTVDRA